MSESLPQHDDQPLHTNTSPQNDPPPQERDPIDWGIVFIILFFYLLPVGAAALLGHIAGGMEGLWVAAGATSILFWTCIALTSGLVETGITFALSVTISFAGGYIVHWFGPYKSYVVHVGLFATLASVFFLVVFLFFVPSTPSETLDADEQKKKHDAEKTLNDAKEKMGTLADIAYNKELYVIVGYPHAGSSEFIQTLHQALGDPQSEPATFPLSLPRKQTKEEALPEMLFFDTSFGRRDILICTLFQHIDPRTWSFLIQHAKGVLLWVNWSSPEDPQQHISSSLWEKQKRWFAQTELQEQLRTHIEQGTYLLQSLEPHNTPYDQEERWQQLLEWLPLSQQQSWTRNYTDHPTQEIAAPMLKLLTLAAQKQHRRAHKELQQHQEDYESSLFS